MQKKVLSGALQLKADGPDGAFRATIATFNVRDRDGDVLIPGCFVEGQAVRISAWGHRWDLPVVGKGEIHQDDSKAWCDGQFFLDTVSGIETYKAVKNLGDLQDWSFGFDIKDQSFGEFEGQDVRFLRSIDPVFECSPVLVGAGINTGTDFIKSANVAVDLTTAERKTLEGVQARYTDAATSIGALLGSAEDPPTIKAEEPATVKAEEFDAGKDGPTMRAGILTVQLDAELVELGAE